MKKGNEKLFMLLFSVSLLVNIRQCSDSQDHDIDIEILEYEVMELESQNTSILRENRRLQETKRPTPKVKEVKKFRPRVKAPEPVDSIDSIPENNVIDSLII